MSKTLFIANLSYEIGKDNLMELFSQTGGVISAHIVMDRLTDKSKGYGFVEMASEEDASRAVEFFNGCEILGREIVVNEARDKA